MHRKIGYLMFTIAAAAVSSYAMARGVRRPGPIAAPEIDPASAMSALTLLAGSVAVLRGRRRK